MCAAVDESLQKAGFLLVTGHGIDPELPAALRATAREFFAMSPEVKAPTRLSGMMPSRISGWPIFARLPSTRKSAHSASS